MGVVNAVGCASVARDAGSGTGPALAAAWRSQSVDIHEITAGSGYEVHWAQAAAWAEAEPAAAAKVKSVTFILKRNKCGKSGTLRF